MRSFCLLLFVVLMLGCGGGAKVTMPSSPAPPPSDAGTFSKMPNLTK